jgi:hypothetical protein
MLKHNWLKLLFAKRWMYKKSGEKNAKKIAKKKHHALTDLQWSQWLQNVCLEFQRFQFGTPAIWVNNIYWGGRMISYFRPYKS